MTELCLSFFCREGKAELFYYLLRPLLLPVFAAVKTAIANVAPQESILTASAAGTAARAASTALISKFPWNIPNQEPSKAPKFRRIQQRNTTSLKISPSQNRFY
jgi:hypothetical protein